MDGGGMVEENGTSAPPDISSNSSPNSSTSIPIVTSAVITSNGVQSVIQSNNQPSVIQSASGLQPVHLSKSGNVILLKNSGGGHSVIQTPQGQLQTLQVVETGSDDSLSNEEDSSAKRRREILTRRPSYRKILNDLGGRRNSGEHQVRSYAIHFLQDSKEDVLLTTDANEHDPLIDYGNDVVDDNRHQGTKVESSGSDCDSNLEMIPTGTLQLSGSSTDGIHLNSGSGGGTLVQYQSQDGELYVPSEIVVQNTSIGGTPQEDQQRKRELRLLKNREAARECRRKKKEYIKCLENRVAVLENQNKALIDELKSLKELYCQTKVE